MEKKTESSVAADMSSTEPVAQTSELGDLIQLGGIDSALAKKMRLVNDAIDQIGWTTYHTKLFCLNGFGYAADSTLGFLASIAANSVVREYNPSYTRAGQLALYIGLLAGALFWGLTADIIGRKWAFNLTLLITATFAIVAGGAPNYASWAAFNALISFGSGGNLVLDTTCFLEYLPSDKTYMVTMMAAWWGLGQVTPGFFAWGYLTNFSCDPEPAVCTRANNMGWRYLYWSCGSLILVMSILRVTIIKFHETPKFSVSNNDDEQVVRTLSYIATKYDRPFSLTVAQLQECGEVKSAHAKRSVSFSELFIHYKGLFSSRRETLSVSLIWFSWALIGMAYPLFYYFLPEYLESRGADFGDGSAYITWRDYTITNLLAIPGPIIASFLCQTKLLGRKYTLTIGGLLSMTFLLAYTTTRNESQNLGFSCAISVCANIYYGTLYAYTPETLPSAHRATGNGTAVAINRLMGVMAIVIASFANTASSVPIWLCASLFGVMGLIAIAFPMEPSRGRSV